MSFAVIISQYALCLRLNMIREARTECMVTGTLSKFIFVSTNQNLYATTHVTKTWLKCGCMDIKSSHQKCEIRMLTGMVDMTAMFIVDMPVSQY